MFWRYASITHSLLNMSKGQWKLSSGGSHNTKINCVYIWWQMLPFWDQGDLWYLNSRNFPCLVWWESSDHGRLIRQYSSKHLLFYVITGGRDLMQEGVQQFSHDDHLAYPWKEILEFGVGRFQPSRTAVDLKDKWRNLQKGISWVSRRHCLPPSTISLKMTTIKRFEEWIFGIWQDWYS